MIHNQALLDRNIKQKPAFKQNDIKFSLESKQIKRSPYIVKHKKLMSGKGSVNTMLMPKSRSHQRINKEQVDQMIVRRPASNRKFNTNNSKCCCSLSYILVLFQKSNSNGELKNLRHNPTTSSNSKFC